jgi:hypothetical protein
MTSKASLAWLQFNWQRPLDPVRGLTALRHLAADQRSMQLVFETRSTADGICSLLGGAPVAVRQASHLIGQLLPGTTATPIKRSIVSDIAAAGLRASTRHRSCGSTNHWSQCGRWLPLWRKFAVTNSSSSK